MRICSNASLSASVKNSAEAGPAEPSIHLPEAASHATRRGAALTSRSSNCLSTSFQNGVPAHHTKRVLRFRHTGPRHRAVEVKGTQHLCQEPARWSHAQDAPTRTTLSWSKRSALLRLTVVNTFEQVANAGSGVKCHITLYVHLPILQATHASSYLQHLLLSQPSSCVD